MTRDSFDPKLLEFLYHLSTTQKKMNSIEAYAELNKKGWKISDRTIRRWFNKLTKSRDINYFSNLRYELFDITTTFVIIEEHNYDSELFKIIPTLTYYVSGISLDSLKKVDLAQYAVPSKNMKEFREFWKKAKELKLIKNYMIIPHQTSITFYAPFHRIINSHGFIEFKKDYKAPEYFMRLYNKISNNKIKTELHTHIRKNPILLPIVYSALGENFSSTKTWNSLKKHSDKIWEFIPKKKLKKGKKDGIAIKYIQEILRLIKENREELFQQIRVSYRPFYQGKHNTYYFLMKLKKGKKLTDLLKGLHERTLQLQYMPTLNKDELMFYIVTNENKLLELIYKFLPDYVDDRYNNKLILQESDPEKNYYGKVDWTMFNPKTKTWNYENKKYLKKLRIFSKTLGQKLSKK